MKIEGATALVTGGNRGLGQELVRELLARGATKVYAASRKGEDALPGSLAITLDVTDAQSIARAAEIAGDVDLLINNAGISQEGVDVWGEDGVDVLRRQFETNTIGTFETTRVFAPILGRNGGGAVVNVLSVLAWLVFPGTEAYSASKAAGWVLTNATRAHLKDQGTQVVGAHVGYMATDMTARLEGVDKLAPEDFARQVLDAVEAGEVEVLGDDVSRQGKSLISGDPTHLAG
jgi:NAD(P)-dependent dehydrogenase (short-subunit alcohol dehydrogenase family)